MDLYMIDALTCLAPIWATFRLAPMPVTEPAEAGRARWGPTAVLAGFRYLSGNTVVLMSFVVDLIAMVLGMPRALFPQLAHENFGGPIEGGTTMALLAGAMSVGVVVGGVFSGWFPRVQRQGPAVIVAIAVWGWRWSASGWSAELHTTGPARWCGRPWAVWRLAVWRTRLRPPSGRRFCSKLPPMICGGGCRECSSWWLPAGPVSVTRCTAPRPQWSERPAAVAGGGALVIVGVLIAGLTAPAFLGYRIQRLAGQPLRSTKTF